MFHILLPCIFNPKIVNNEGERNRSGSMLPKARRMFAFVVSVGGKSLSKELVRQNAGLG